MITSISRAAMTASVMVAVLGGAGPAARAAATSPATTTIHIKDFAYRPTPVTVHVGDRVTFVNDDDEAHTVTAADKSYDSGGLDTGNRWDHVFTKPGTYAYFCALHPYMKASIVVAPADKSTSAR